MFGKTLVYFIRNTIFHFLTIMLIGAGWVHAREIHVDRTVITSGDGSPSAPYKTIQAGINNAVAGDTVLIHGDNIGRIYTENISMVNNGNSSSPITIKSASYEKVIIQHSSTINLNKDFIIIQDLTFDHQNVASDAIIWSGDNNILRRCVLRNGQQDGIDFSAGSSNNLVEGCTIHDFKVIPQADCHGIVTSPPFYNLQIISNTIFNCSGDALQTYHDHSTTGSASSTSSNLLIVANLMYSTLGVNAENALDFKDGSFITVRDNEMYGYIASKAIVCQKYHKNLIFDGNRIHDSKSGIECRGEPIGIIQTNITIVRNVFYNLEEYAVKFDGVVNGNVYNNTVVNSDLRSFFSEIGGTKGGNFKNNLIFQSGPASFDGPFTVSRSNNGWFGSSPGDFSGAGDVSGSFPGFVSPTDFHLLSTSPCINKGVAVGYAYFGSVPDLGAYEFGLSPTSDGKIHVVAIDSMANEAGSNTSIFSIIRSPSNTSPLVVQYNLTGSAINGSDYLTLSGIVTIPANATNTTVVINPINDSLVEGKENVTLSIQPNSNYEVSSYENSDKVIIWDDETLDLPEVNVVASDSKSGEPGTDTGRFTITRNPDGEGSLTVNLAIHGNATNGTDYTTIPISVTFNPGVTSMDVIVSPIDDTISEGRELVILEINASPSYVMGNSNSALITILDDEPTPVSISVSDPVASESGPDMGTFIISLVDELSVPLTVAYQVTGTATSGTDFIPLSGSVTIPPGSTSATITVTPITDAEVETTETVIVTLVDGSTYDLGTKFAATLNIGDLTRSTVYFSSAANLMEPALNGSFTFGRIGVSSNTCTVLYEVTGTASNGVDYVTLSGSATIPNNSSSVSVPITVINDSHFEGTESIVISILDGPGYILYSEAYRKRTASLIDDEIPSVNVSTVYYNARENGPSGNFRFTRTGESNITINVNYELAGVASNGVDYAALSGTLILESGINQTNLLINPISDNLVEGNENVNLILLPSLSYSLGTTTNATLIISDPLPVIEVTSSDPTASESGSNNGKFKITRTADGSNSTLVVYYNLTGTATNGTDYTTLATSVTFNPGVLSKTLTVTPKHDSINEGSETVNLGLYLPFYLGTYQVGVSTNATVTIWDQVQTKIDLTPSLITLPPSGTQAFTAVLEDQFGDPMFTQPSFTWNVDGGGSINTSGLFTAGSTLGGPWGVRASANGFSDVAHVSVGIDNNADGLPDNWQTTYFSAATDPNAAPNNDPDGDKFNNKSEYIAQTQPNNSASRLTFTSQSVNAAGDCVMSWQSVPGITYSLEWSSDLINWNTFNSYTATTPLSSWIDSGEGNSVLSRFYRVKIP